MTDFYGNDSCVTHHACDCIGRRNQEALKVAREVRAQAHAMDGSELGRRLLAWSDRLDASPGSTSRLGETDGQGLPRPVPSPSYEIDDLATHLADEALEGQDVIRGLAQVEAYHRDIEDRIACAVTDALTGVNTPSFTEWLAECDLDAGAEQDLERSRGL